MRGQTVGILHVTAAGRAGAQRAGHILPDDQSWTFRGDDIALEAPQTGSGALTHSRTLAGQTHILTGATARHHVHVGQCGHVDFGDVAQIGSIGEPVGEHGARPGFDIGYECGIGWSQRHLDGQIKTAVA